MLENKNSKLYFLFGCIPMRIFIAMLPLYLDKSWLPFYGLVLLAIAIGLLYLYFTNKRLHAPEAGGDTWWAKYRILHGLLYMSAAIYAFNKSQLASLPLFIDILLGLVLFVHQHWMKR